MKFGLLSGAAFLLAATQSGLALAAMSDADAQQFVSSSVSDGFSSDAVVEALVEDGLDLITIGEIVVKASTGDAQIDLARAAICAAYNTEEAEKVGNRAIATVGTGVTADTIEGIVQTYETTGCALYVERLAAPPMYAPTNTGSGGGVNRIPQPPGGGTDSGTVPPPGLVTPGSPAN